MGIKSNFTSPSERQRPPSRQLEQQEAPWLKDRRMYEQKKRNKQQFQKRVRRFEHSPAGSVSTTSTDSVRSTPSASKQQQQQYESTNPFASPSPLHHPQHRPPMQPVHRGTNPFESPLQARPPMQAANGTNPFESPLNQKRPPMVQNGASTNPFDTPSRVGTNVTPQTRNGTGDWSVDSLNEVLEGGYQMPSTYSIAEESETTTLSDQAIEAAKALKASFYTNRRKNAGSTPRRQPPPTIPETEPEPNPQAYSVDRKVSAQLNNTRQIVHRPPQQQHRRAGPVDLDVTLDTAEFTADPTNMELHDMCDAAQATNDSTWRKAIFLLSVEPETAKNIDPDSKMTALHVCSLGLEPPPIWMTRALLYTHPEQTQHPDSGGRLPLHLLAATSADLDTMQLFVEEYPASVGHKDDRGFTPLQLMLKNDQIILTLEHLRILLGQTAKDTMEEEPLGPMNFRKGDHLNQSPEELELRRRFEKEQKHEVQFAEYPDDVRSCLNKIQQWKHRQVTKGLLFRPIKLFASADSPNPASIATPTGKLLPLHLLVRRPPQAPPRRLVKRPPGRAADLIRVLVNSYPQALVTKDAQDRTPLLMAMTQTDYQPDLEMIELLLGIGTPGFHVSPSESPAALSSSSTFQLPLHICAEEMTYNYTVLSTIYESYPQAVSAQDVRGRAPLHLALRNFRSIPVDEPTLALLFEDKVARLKDHDGKTPFDLVLRNPDFLKPTDSMVLQEFLNASIGQPNDFMESEELLHKLRRLPPWIRNHACAAHHVQEVLMEEVTSPLITFWILFNGAVMIALLVFIRMLLDAPTNTILIAIYVVSSLLLVNQVIYWLEAILVGEFYRLCAANPWRWIDVISGYMALATSYLIAADMRTLETIVGTTSGFVPSEADPLVSTVGAVTTISIWISLIGYFVEWWCGMAVFFGSAMELLRSLFWPLVVAAVGIVGISQVMYTLDDCGQEQTCRVSDTYTTVYSMVLGEPVLFTEEESTSMPSPGLVAMVVSFTLLWIWWILSVVVVAVTEARQLNHIQIALKWYWEPKIAVTVLSGGRRTSKKKMSARPSFVRRFSGEMGRIWHVFVASFRGETIRDKKRDAYWYSCFNLPGVIHFTRLLAIIVIPVWLVLGAATLGLLWPPQVRRWLFATKMVDARGTKQSSLEEQLTASKLSSLKAELMAFQSTTANETHATQTDIQEIKELLYSALGRK